ncbi:MAG: hypothetical protein JWP80_2706 [Pseudomonas sp.]|nr:hypothetical protein [Pseudomonas sp.]
MGRLQRSKTDREAPLRQGQRYWAKQRPSLKKVAQCNGKNSECVGAAEGCDKVGTTFNNRKSATGSRPIAAFGSSYRESAAK